MGRFTTDDDFVLMRTAQFPGEAAILGEQRAAEARVVAEVTFPRASEQQSREYYFLYSTECRALMKAWIVQQFDTLTTHPPTERLALLVAHELMVAETKRAPNQHESRLIGECVRDLLTVHFIERDLHEARTRELEREVL